MKRVQLVWIGVLAALLALPAGWAPRAAAQDDGTGLSTPWPTPTPAAVQEGVLPGHRILSYYGFPGNELMGILGEYPMGQLRSKLRQQAQAYEAAAPSRPFKLAFEVIATVAQREPQADGSYLVRTGDDIIKQYADYTAAHDMLLILDVQLGRHSVTQEIESLRSWLELPHVELALDPEFAIQPGQTPGVDLGSIDAADVLTAQQALANLAAEKGIPPKILIVHQFNSYSLSNKDRIAPVPGVQLVVEADGFGPPDEKRTTYGIIVGKQPIEYNGFKLFYKQDAPLMSPEDVLALQPSPDLIIYQ